MSNCSLHQTLQLFAAALDALPGRIPPAELERLGAALHRWLSIHARRFHTPEHIFNLAETTNPIHTLAALFHDVVYYQVDERLMPEVQAAITPYICEKGGDIFITTNGPLNDHAIRLCLGTFGFSPGQQLLPAQGLNEFLSALFMCRQLSPFVDRIDLLRLVACIEMTIPFRDQDCAARLAERLAQLNAELDLGLPPDQLEQAVRAAVIFGNKDVENFSEPDAAHFLSYTWKLLPETNTPLREAGLYSICDYREALRRMEHFFSAIIDPANVFHQYHGAPPDDEWHRLTKLARQNIEIARKYLGIKLVALACLEALADLSGGDAPLALFMGDLPGQCLRHQRVEDFLPPPPERPEPDLVILRLLNQNWVDERSFDMRAAPLSLFIYCSLADETLAAALTRAKEMFAGRLAPPDFLAALDRKVISAIARASAEMAFTRREALLRYAAP